MIEFKKPSVTADIIVEKEDSVLLVKRKYDPYRNYWALPGGFLDVDNETVKQTAQRELKEETGLIVKLEDLELVGESSNPNRDPRGHIVSLHYHTERYKGNLNADDDAEEVRFFSLESLPELAFDHGSILNYYFKINNIK